MNGMECLTAIRKNPDFVQVPVLMYSTSAHEKHLNESFVNGANLFIKKANSLPEQVSIMGSVIKLFKRGDLLNTQMADFKFSAYHEAGT